MIIAQEIVAAHRPSRASLGAFLDRHQTQARYKNAAPPITVATIRGTEPPPSSIEKNEFRSTYLFVRSKLGSVIARYRKTFSMSSHRRQPCTPTVATDRSPMRAVPLTKPASARQ